MVFGGIISSFADVEARTDRRIIAKLPAAVAESAQLGDSIALNGVCLTVVERNGNTLAFDLSDETLKRTTFGLKPLPSRMHCEPALRLNDAVGGHMISGHVHGIGAMKSLNTETGEMIIHVPRSAFAARPLFKDSISIDGVSLTVAQVLPDEDCVSVALIPHTLANTLFAKNAAGTPVNVELNIATLQRHAEMTEKDSAKDDEYWMKEAIKVGEKGRFTAPPNPWVGAVLVDPWGTQIASGFHTRPGAPHAEREIKEPMGGCTLYVTLEPCSHTGRTPPCVEYLLQQKPARVVVGTVDPDERVSGRGIQALKDANIPVTVGVCEEEVRHSLRAYLWHRSNFSAPYVVCKLALSQDNCYAYATDTEKERQWITGEAARRHGHGERAASQRLVIGKNTEAMDKPRLDVRYDYVVDKQPEKIVSTRALEWLKPNPDVLQVLVEGGAELEDDLLHRNVVNEFVLYRSTKIIGLQGVRWNPSFQSSHWELAETTTFPDGDTMQRFIRKCPARAATEATAAGVAARCPPDGDAWAELKFDTIESALDALRRGEPVVVMDDESRENEGDMMLLADRLTLRSIKTLLAHTTGIVCATMTQSRATQLNLPLMVPPQDNKESHRTKFTLSVDAAAGVTTGVSAADRMVTLGLLARGSTKPTDLVRPGHVFPLVAAAGGILERRGHTETGVELARMVGGCEHPVMVISELYDKNTGRMMTALQCRQLGFPMIHIEALAQRLSKWAMWASVPLQHHAGDWRLAVVAGCKIVACGDPIHPGAPDPNGAKRDIVLRIHSECFTGDVLGSSLCDCGNQLHAGLHEISLAKNGGLIIFPAEQEGRGIGLSEKVKAYSLQRNQGMDTFTANEVLGHPKDVRTYDGVIFALKHIGVLPTTHRIVLLTENPAKLTALHNAGFEAHAQALQCAATEHNGRYLMDKRAEFLRTPTTTSSPTAPPGLCAQHLLPPAAGGMTMTPVDSQASGSTMLMAPAPTTVSLTGEPHACAPEVPVAAAAGATTAAGSAASLQSHLMKQAPKVIALTDEERVKLRSTQVCIVQAEWHRHMSDPLVQTIVAELAAHYGITTVRRVLAPGSFELPRVIQHLASRDIARGATTVYVAVGILVRGDTDHYDLVARETTANLQRVSLDRELWVVNCVLACHTMRQVEERCLEYYDKCVGPHMAQAVARLSLLSKES